MSLLFLTYGPTHSGKTTFGAKLAAALGESAKFIHVDNDLVDGFIKDNFNNLRTDKEILATRTPSNPDLRLLIPQLIAGYALKENYNVIATAAHPRRIIRRSYYNIAKKSGAKVVLLIFRIDDAAASLRIQANGRSSAILDISPHGGATFQDLYDKQKKILEEPTIAEKQSCFKVLEVTPSNADEMLAEAIKLAQGSGQ
jgi:tRNA A37 N6-isopentenylltransferase MiaA